MGDPKPRVETIYRKMVLWGACGLLAPACVVMGLVMVVLEVIVHALWGFRTAVRSVYPLLPLRVWRSGACLLLAPVSSPAWLAPISRRRSGAPRRESTLAWTSYAARSVS